MRDLLNYYLAKQSQATQHHNLGLWLKYERMYNAELKRRVYMESIGKPVKPHFNRTPDVRKLFESDYQFASDMPEDYLLITDSQEIQAIADSGVDHPYPIVNYGCLWVKVGDGDYESIYGSYGIVPYLDRRVYKIL